MVSNTARAKKYGMMEHPTKESTNKTRSTDMGYCKLLTVRATKVNSNRGNLMAKASTFGKTKSSTRANGKTIK